MVAFISSLSFAGAQDFAGLDKSPLDVAYYPQNFAHKHGEGEKPLVKVYYSRPQKKNRDIGTELAPFGKVWRTGANEASQIEFFQNTTVGGKNIKKGTYTLFTIPGKDKWTIIFNSDLDVWGAYTYNEKKDVLRVDANTEDTSKDVEAFTIQFDGDGKDSATMLLAWGDKLVKVPMKF